MKLYSQSMIIHEVSNDVNNMKVISITQFPYIRLFF